MKKDGNHYIVHKKALPEVLQKTVEVNSMLQRSPNMAINEAVTQVGISRSAYYKYKDFIQPFFQLNESSIATFYLVLDHTPGVLSAILDLIASQSGNVLTINQNLPLMGMANVTISIDVAKMVVDYESLIELLLKINGVVKAGLVSKN